MGPQDGSSVEGGRYANLHLRFYENNGFPCNRIWLPAKNTEEMRRFHVADPAVGLGGLEPLLPLEIPWSPPLSPSYKFEEEKGGKGRWEEEEEHESLSFAQFCLRHFHRNHRFCVPGAPQYKEIVYDGTLYEGTKYYGKPYPISLMEGGVLPGTIKVHKDTIEVAGKDKETATQGHDDLGKRCGKDYELGACFAKWPVVLIKIDPNKPSQLAIDLTAHGGYKRCVRASVPKLGMTKEILMISTGTSASGTYLEVILDTASAVNVTGVIDMFVPAWYEPEGFDIRAANGNKIECYMCGYLSHEKYHINYVYFSPDVGPRTIISGPELDSLGYTLKFEGGKCEVRDKGILVGEGCLVEKTRYLMEYLRIPLDRALQVKNEEAVPVPDELQVANEENVPVPEELQVANEEAVPVPDESVFTTVWRGIRTVLRRFSA